MFRDRFDQIHLLAAVIVLAAIGLLLTGFSGDGGRTRPFSNQAVEQAMQEKARAVFLLETFQPIEALIADDRQAEALLKLQEYEKLYPGEAHTLVLRAGILVDQGGLGEGIAQYAAAVKMNGDYVDAKSRLNRRAEISRLVESSIPRIRESLRSGENPSLEKSLKDLYYLQSRLAGGCE